MTIAHRAIFTLKEVMVWEKNLPSVASGGVTLGLMCRDRAE